MLPEFAPAMMAAHGIFTITHELGRTKQARPPKCASLSLREELANVVVRHVVHDIEQTGNLSGIAQVATR